jgi:hypothetical protein
MYRYFFRFVVMTLTILTVNLIAASVTAYMISYKNHYNPIAFTFLGMAVTVVILYPLFARLEIWVKDISLRAVRSGKSFGGKYSGLLLTFVASLTLLCYFYGKMWYHIDFFQMLIHGRQ